MQRLTHAILSLIRARGYLVKTFTVNGVVEMHAVPLDCKTPPQIARCNDGDGPEEQYRCACLLAVATGLELEDG